MLHSISQVLVVAAALFASSSSATAIGKKPETELLQQARVLQTYTASDNFQALMLQAVNAERAAQGKAPFCTNKKLQTAAQLHSEDQAANNMMSHTGSNGSTMSDRVNAQSFSWNGIAENVASGQVDVAAVMKSWMNSPGHKANILGNYKFFGTGYAYNAKGTYKHYWTQDFGVGAKEVCDSDGTVQIGAPTTASPVPTTASPAVQQTSAPVTPAPTTTTPVVTPAPTSAAPVVTPAPSTPAPVTMAPAATPAPTSPVQQTSASVTPAPTTLVPTTAAPTSPVQQTSAPAAVGLTMQTLMLQAVNAERAAQGKAPLCANKKLQVAAQLHSEDQATTNVMSHTGSNGSTMDARVTTQDFNWNGVAENVAAGQADVAAVMKSWMNSPGHKANILGNYKFFGMGYAYNTKGTYKHYWTQDFGSGAKEVCE